MFTMKNLYTLLKSTSRLLLFLLTFTAFTGAFSVSAQTQVGDYRSKATGNWTALTTWERCNSISPETWAEPTTAQGYPGQFAGTKNVSIIGGNVVTLNASILSSFTTLTINGVNSTTRSTLSIPNNANYNINTLTVKLTNYGQLSWADKKGDFIIPAGGTLIIESGGYINSPDCSANNRIVIGGVNYASCSGGNALFSFSDLNSNGGTLSVVASSNAPICEKSILTLTATKAGFSGTPLTYVWTGSGPGGYTFSNTYQVASSTLVTHPTVSPTLTTPGSYTFSVNVADTYLNYTSTISVFVNTPSTPPTSILTNPTPATICNGSPIILTADGGTHGTGATYEWGTGTVGTNIIAGQTNATYTTSPTATTTYWVRRKDPAPCNTVTGGASTTVTVNTPSTAPTSITGTLVVCSGTNTTLTATGGTLGTGASYEWGTGSTVGSNVISGATGVSYTTPNLSTATTYWVRRKDPAPCNTTTNAATATVTIKPNVWVGTTNSDWNTLTNWTCKIPGINEDVIFSTSPNPTNDLILDTDRTIGSLTNNSDKALIIPTSKALTISGTASNNAPERLVIQSANDAVNGSLIFTQPTSNQNVQASVEMYSKAYRDPVGMTVTAPDNTQYKVYYKWQYFGIPVKSAVYNTVFEAEAPVSYVRRSDETLNSDAVYYNEWVQLYNADPLTPFTGYEITQNTTQAAGKKITFKGALVTGEKTLNLTYTASPNGMTNPGSGYNIFGNSFTAAIDISKIQFPASGVDKVVYLYNTGSLYDWYNVEVNDAPGSYLSIPQNTSGDVQREIPSMQGFMLIASANNSSVTIPYSTSVLNNTFVQRAPSAGNTGLSYLTADVLGKSGGDRVWLFSQPGTSRKYDNGWDGRKIILNPGFSLYVDEGKDQLQVSTSDNLDKTYLAFRAGKDTEYTLRINKAKLTDYQTLYLTDLATKTVVDLSAQNEFSYTFTATNTAKAERRFLITSKDKKENLKTQKVKIFNTNNIVRIDNPTDESGTVQLYDMYGQLRFTSAFDASGVTEINTMLPASVYVVRVKSAGVDQSGKIVVSR